jgi:hypothetical protein
VRGVLEQELVDNRGFVSCGLVVATIDHGRELNGAHGFRELGVESVGHAITEDDLEGGKVRV